ncbi:cellulose binding domain-containing protein [Actinoplanes siamensis]|uniref:CBM2 domain-containing protein n=1 Tax=Actinoplanes siamensis TaxID=1223317 RepID=A0A919N6W5_9ACTN|nr:cellulose binding domain-containing protein [Actinoplanes siamensis]GIF05450.1 hypothetical protein Asi03nite_29880 [Actinoplanes siamensis]
MNDTPTRRRRSLSVVVLDGMLRLYSALQSGPTPTPKVRQPGQQRRFGRYVLVAGVLVALAGTALLVVVLVRGPGGPASPPDPAGALPAPPSRPAAGAPSVLRSAAVSGPPASRPGPASASARAVGSPAPGAPAGSASAPAAQTSPVPLTASYGISSLTAGLLGYKMTVTVANPGPVAKDGWTVTVTLPRSTLRVANVSGATATQSGSTWTFVPDTSTSRVPAGGSVAISFGVNGATLIDAAPQDCQIDGNTCTA